MPHALLGMPFGGGRRLLERALYGRATFGTETTPSRWRIASLSARSASASGKPTLAMARRVRVSATSNSAFCSRARRRLSSRCPGASSPPLEEQALGPTCVRLADEALGFEFLGEPQAATQDVRRIVLHDRARTDRRVESYRSLPVQVDRRRSARARMRSCRYPTLPPPGERSYGRSATIAVADSIAAGCPVSTSRNGSFSSE